MRKLMVAASAAALLVSSTFAAFAAEATGAVKSIDMTAKTVTLEDGKIYVLPTGFDTASIKVGDKVKITFDEADGKMTATEVVPST